MLYQCFSIILVLDIFPKTLTSSWEVLQLYSVFSDANSDHNLAEDKFNEH